MNDFSDWLLQQELKVKIEMLTATLSASKLLTDGHEPTEEDIKQLSEAFFKQGEVAAYSDIRERYNEFTRTTSATPAE